MRQILLALLLALAPMAASAQTYTRNATPDPGQYVPVFAIACLDNQGRALPPGSASCVAAQGMTVSGTVTANQGTAGTAPWPTVIYVAGAAASAANPSPVAVQNFPASQTVTIPDSTIPSGYPLTITATGPLPGFRTAGYATLIGTLPTGTASINVEFSSDSTDGVNGNWSLTSGGFIVQDSIGAFGTVTNFNNGGRTGEFRAAEGVWARFNVVSYTSGATLTATLRTAPFTPRDVYVRNSVGIYEQGSATASVGITPVITTGATSLVGKASAGNLYGAYAYNTSATASFLVAINATAAPAASSAITPVECVPLPASGAATVNYGAGPPDAYSTGIVILISTSCTTYTAGGASFIKARVR